MTCQSCLPFVTLYWYFFWRLQFSQPRFPLFSVTVTSYSLVFTAFLGKKHYHRKRKREKIKSGAPEFSRENLTITFLGDSHDPIKRRFLELVNNFFFLSTSGLIFACFPFSTPNLTNHLPQGVYIFPVFSAFPSYNPFSIVSLPIIVLFRID